MKKGPLLADGRTAQIFAWENGRVVKLFRTGFPPAQATYEAECVRAVYAAGVATPELIGVVELEGQKGLIFERAVGPTMLQAVLANPESVEEHAQLLAVLHAELHGRTAGGLASLIARLRHKIQRARPLPEAWKASVVDSLDRLPDGDAICHGDFHPGNIIMTAGGPSIIDWVDVTQGPPLADVARTSLLLGMAAPLPEAGDEEKQRLQEIRHHFLRVYLDKYNELRPFDREELEAWQLPVAAARLEEGIAEEEAALLKMVRASR